MPTWLTVTMAAVLASVAYLSGPALLAVVQRRWGIFLPEPEDDPPPYKFVPPAPPVEPEQDNAWVEAEVHRSRRGAQ